MGIRPYENQVWPKNVEKVDWQASSYRTVPSSNPLLTYSEIKARLGAVEEIKESTSYKLEDAANLLTRLPDLEKGLVRIHYGRCSRPELLSILNAFSRVASKFSPVDKPKDVGFKSTLINNAIYSLPAIADDVATFLSSFNHDEAAKDNKFDMFKDEEKYDTITIQKMAIVAVEADLDEHLLEIRKMLKHSKLTYVTVAGIEVLLFYSVLILVLNRSQERRRCQSAKELDQS
jgi:DNA mismatch repair protein MSH3